MTKFEGWLLAIAWICLGLLVISSLFNAQLFINIAAILCAIDYFIAMIYMLTKL